MIVASLLRVTPIRQTTDDLLYIYIYIYIAD